MKQKSTFNASRKALVLGLTTAAANSSFAESGVCISKVQPSPSQQLITAVESKFKQVHGIQLDWSKAIEVTDDAEGNNCIFSTDNGRTVTLPIESATNTAPNKFTKE